MPTDPVARALEIEGYTTEAQLRWLAQEAVQHKRILEIGCWKGRSTFVLAAHTKGTVLSIDTFSVVRASSTPITRALHAQGPYGIYAEWCANMREFVEAKRANVIWGDSQVVLPCLAEYEPGTYDMIFIDGNHAYEPVRHDIESSLTLLAPGGLLCGDDLRVRAIKRAAKELVPGFTVPAPDLWSWRKPDEE